MNFYKLLKREEVGKIFFLKSVTSNPKIFLDAQNKLLYNKDLSIFHKGNRKRVNNIGLPIQTDNFYKARRKKKLRKISSKTPLILNIGSGSEISRKLAAINIDLSPEGEPEVKSDARHLPFEDGMFSVVRASHVLEHIPQKNIISTLSEWKRVLHKHGELQIAVPDADIAFQEIISGKTPKGKPTFSFKESTAPLVQIYGLGYNNPKTDKRWSHKIIFSYPLLKYFLEKAGFTSIRKRERKEDLAFLCGIDDDSQNHYSLLIAARNEKEVHYIDNPLTEKSFHIKTVRFRNKHSTIPYASFIIPIYNESRNLKYFLASLEHATNKLAQKREFAFVLNGCTDNSEKIICRYSKESYLNIKTITSKKGIINALKAGIAARKLQGFVGKLDADIILHPHVLDLMSMCLTDNPEICVTYAEPVPIDSKNIYNEAEHSPMIRSKRLYFHGRASLYQKNPFETIEKLDIFKHIFAEDLFLSFYFVYFYGLDSIKRAPFAFIYSKTVNNYRDLAKQILRTKLEKEKIFKFYPPFAVIDQLLERELYPSDYKILFDKATSLNVKMGTAKWTRIESTK